MALGPPWHIALYISPWRHIISQRNYNGRYSMALGPHDTQHYTFHCEGIQSVKETTIWLSCMVLYLQKLCHYVWCYSVDLSIIVVSSDHARHAAISVSCTTLDHQAPLWALINVSVLLKVNLSEVEQKYPTFIRKTSIYFYVKNVLSTLLCCQQYVCFTESNSKIKVSWLTPLLILSMVVSPTDNARMYINQW